MVILWDFNGTIIDDVDICLKAENTLFAKYQMDINVSRQQYLELFEFPVINYYKKIGFDFNKVDFKTVSKEFMELYLSYQDEYRLNQGVLKKLKESKNAGNTNVIISASEQQILNEQCKKLDISKYFDEICGLDNVEAHSKLDMAKSWLEKHNYHRDNILFIGDSVHDFEVANSLNVNCYLVASGHQSKQKLLAATNNVVDSITEVKIC